MANGWTMYFTNAGDPYYHNGNTQETLWDRPKDLDPKPDKAKVDPAANWVEYQTGDKKLYYNIVTKRQQFERPPELGPEPKVAAASTPQAEEPNAEADKSAKPKATTPLAATSPGVVPLKPPISTNSTSDIDKKPKINKELYQVIKTQLTKNEKRKHYATKEEAMADFRALLEESSVGENDTWMGILPKIVHDTRYRALRTVQERKKCFKKFKEEIVERNQDLAEKKLAENKESFTKMLDDASLDGGMSYDQVMDVVRDDTRSDFLEGKERRAHVEDYIKNLARREKEDRRKKFSEACQKFDKIVRDLEEVTYQTRYSDIEDKLKETDEDTFNALDSRDRKEILRKYVAELEKIHEEEKEKERKNRHEREEKENGEFKAMLNAITYDSEVPIIHAKSKWQDIQELEEFISLPPWAPYKEGDRDRLKAAWRIFEKFCAEMDAGLKPDKAKLKPILKANSVTISPGDTVPDLMDKVKDNTEVQALEVSHVRLLFKEMIAKAIYKNSHKQQQKMKKEKKVEEVTKRERTRSRERAKEKKRKKERSRSKEKSSPRKKSKRSRSRGRDKKKRSRSRSRKRSSSRTRRDSGNDRKKRRSRSRSRERRRSKSRERKEKQRKRSSEKKKKRRRSSSRDEGKRKKKKAKTEKTSDREGRKKTKRDFPSEKSPSESSRSQSDEKPKPTAPPPPSKSSKHGEKSPKTSKKAKGGDDNESGSGHESSSGSDEATTPPSKGEKGDKQQNGEKKKKPSPPPPKPPMEIRTKSARSSSPGRWGGNSGSNSRS